jgi:primase-polymerase (primpol)-like protein
MNSAVTKVHADLRVPDDLVELDQWLLWRYEQRNNRRTKVPYQVSGKTADTTQPRTWTTFENAITTWNLDRRRYSGIGFVFSKQDNLVGIDLDDALDSRGHVKAWARGVVERFLDTYMEVSPSSRGLKIWTRGALPANLPGVPVGDGAIELYDHSRYFAVTGKLYRGAPLEVEDHHSDLQRLYRHLTSNSKRWKVQPQEGGQIPHGQQHSTLVSLAGTLRARRVCDEAIEACLQLVNARQCQQPGPPEHISRIVRSSRTWGPA